MEEEEDMKFCSHSCRQCGLAVLEIWAFRQRSPSPPPCSPDPYANIRRPKRFFSPLRGRRTPTPPPCAPSPCAPAPCAPSPCAPPPCSPARSAPPPCSPDPYANIRRPKRFFSPIRGRRARTPPPCAPSPCAPAPCAPAPCAPAPCAPPPSSAPPCSPDPYANIRRPKRFFSPIRGRRAATPPPCAPSPCAPAPCAPAPPSPPPCSPDPYANIRRPKRYFSPLAALAKSVSLEYDEDPFYGSNYSGREVESCCCSPPPPSPEPCPASPGRHRSSVPKGFYTLTGDISPKSTPRRT
ncbi:uncharacterized protein LOC126135097 [Schistocerca cancellata]|uniref:uncharacterized protein LOC126135097 n=1 Tax=Schistocerca cancellata TaxID=274614 RepID=UPI00211976FC|nr:uncharacterized protein LOC126135097 [Schistocerca cancellata]